MNDGQQTEFSLDFVGRTYRLISSSSEWKEDISKILNGETYPLVPFITDIETIFDIGADIGMASIFFKAAYPMARIYSFEPDPGTFSMLRRNVGHFVGIRAFDFGLFDRNATARLRIEKADSKGNSVSKGVSSDDLLRKVSLRDVQDIIYANEITSIDLLKLNAEACEIPILRQLKSLLGTIKIVYVEFHSENCRREVDALLKDTHVLHSAKVTCPNRGQFCFVSKTASPSTDMSDQTKIEIDHLEIR